MALKGANRDFCCCFFFLAVSSLRRELSPTRTLKWTGCNRVQITSNTSGAYDVQHAVCLVVQRDSSAIKFDRDEIVFTLASSHWPKPSIVYVAIQTEKKKKEQCLNTDHGY